MQFINQQTFTQNDKLITIPNSTTIWGIAATSDNIIVGDEGMIHCLDVEGTYLRTITLSTRLNKQIDKGSLTSSLSFNTPLATVQFEFSRCMVFVSYPTT
jgi:hypothetical protein